MTRRDARNVVTGASGFIGSHLVRRLVASGRQVVAVVGPAADLWRLRDVVGSVELVRCDVAALTADEVAGPVGTVFHLAAAGVGGQAEAQAMLETNVLGTLRVAELARDASAARLVHCGSCFEYGTGSRLREDAPLAPVSAYAISKAAATLLAADFGRRHALPVVCLRLFTAFGPAEAAHRLVPHSILQALDGAPVELTGGEQTRDFVFLDDVVDALLAAATARGAAGETINVCTGVETRVGEIARQAAALADAGAEVRLGALPYRDDELWTISGDPDRAAELLGWRAKTSVSEGLAATAAWLREHRSVYDAIGAGVG